MRLGVLALGVAWAVAGCNMPASPQAAPTGGPIADGASQIVVSGDPRASAAGLEMLRQGGSAIDAAVAAQAVLGLVEPQASGFLGGSVIVTWDPATKDLATFDGMPTAPAAATRGLALTPSGKLLDPRDVAFSGRAVGVPGTLPALWSAHRAQGKLPWASLFAPAIALAEQGVAVSRPLHDLLAQPGAKDQLGEAGRRYFAADGTALATGQSYRNAPYAAVLKRVARLGPDGLYAESGLAAVLDSLHRGPHPSLITADDLQGASARLEHAVCAPWHALQVCTAPPPAMGGVVMLQILGMVNEGDPTDPNFVHRFLEASRLAEADRRRYLADPAFVPVPLAELLDPHYLQGRAALIQPDSTIARAMPGDPDDDTAPTAWIPDPGAPQSATSSVAVVDASGHALAMTSTINLHFGARIGAEGMVFNNALINFAPPPPTTLPGRADRYANEMAGGKRPLSPVAPVIVLGADGSPVLVGGGAGGPPIPDTMAMTLIRVLARGMSPADALAAPHAHASDPDHIALEQDTAEAALRAPLEALGHDVQMEPVDTGNVVLLHTPSGWTGSADPRRDGGPAQGLR